MYSHLKTFVMLFLLSFNVVSAGEYFSEELNLTDYPHNSYGYSYEALEEGISFNFTNWRTPDFSGTSFEEGNPSMLEATLECSHPVMVKRSLAKTQKGKKLLVNVFDKTKGRLIILDKNTTCRFNYMGERASRSILIYPYNKNINHLWSKFSFNDEEATYSDLEDGIEAINKRVEILTGKRISVSEINERNPKMDLDFSKLPKYDFILLSTLQFNNDYVSHMVFKALAEHAKRGTPVIVVGNKILVGAKEAALLEWLQKQSPLIKILKYEYVADTKKLGDQFDRLHRVSHVKVLVTYSKNRPQDSHVIFGGRNNSDRYFYPEFKKFDSEEYTQFDKELFNTWAYFHDLEYYAQSDKLGKRIITSMMNYLKLETPESQMYLGSNIDDVQFSLSVPYKDKNILEKEYVDLIDKAKEKIVMMSPYIYFTDEIDKALARAYERGVHIEAITSASLLGDDMTKSLKGIYDKFSNQRRAYIDVYSYMAGHETVMHRKALMVDSKILMLGSVNLSKRSFYHDIENNLTITNKSIIESFKRIYESQLKESEQIVKASKTTIAERIVKLLDQENLL